MGIILGIEAVVGIVEATEAAVAAAEVGEGIAGAAEAAEAVTAGAEAGADAGAEAGGAAAEAAEAGGEALSNILELIAKALAKLGKMIEEFVVIDAVFKAGKAILEAITSDPAAKARVQKLKKLIDVLTTSSKIMQGIYDWLKKHASDTTKLDGIDIPVSGVLSKFLPKLGGAVGVLQSLSRKIAAQNLKKDPITDGQVEAFEHGLITVAQSFKELNDFKKQHESKVPLLKKLPIDDAKVASVCKPLQH